MMRLILLLLSLPAFSLPAQVSIDRSVIAAAGGGGSVSDMHLNWTLGEPAAATLEGPSLLLTQGFQQNSALSTPVLDVDEPPLQITVFPNPASTVLHLRIEGQTPPLLVRMLNMHGRELTSFEWSGQARTLDLRSWPAAVYLLQFLHQGRPLSTLRFAKVRN